MKLFRWIFKNWDEGNKRIFVLASNIEEAKQLVYDRFRQSASFHAIEDSLKEPPYIFDEAQAWIQEIGPEFLG